MARTARGSCLDNRQKILDAAMALISEKGVGKTSLSEISKAAGLSKGTLYHYYASKNELIFDIADLHMERITRALFSLIEDNKALSWEDLLTAFFDLLLTSRDRSRLHLYLVREAVSGNESLRDRFQQTYAQWFGLVDQAYEQMPRLKGEIPAKAKFLVAVVDGFIIQDLLNTNPTAVKEIVHLILKTIHT